MTRTFIVLIVAALATCIVGVPVLLVGGDDDTAPHRAPGRTVDTDDAAAAHGRGFGGFAWLRALPFVEAQAEANRDANDDARLGPALVALDRTFSDGVAKCAPEILGYDRALLTKLQPDWRELKPNLHPSWDAWRGEAGVELDEEKLRSCTETFAHGDCTAMEDAWSECTMPFRGTLGEGDACETNEQCASTTCANNACTRPNDCAKISDCPSGMLCADDGTGSGFVTCIEAPPDGGHCLDGVDMNSGPAPALADLVNAQCGRGRACDVNDQCFPVKTINDKCGAGAPCAPGLWCDDDKAECVLDTDEAPVDEVENSSPEDVANSEPDGEEEGCACDPYRDGKACIDRDDGSTQCVAVSVVAKGSACDATHICVGSLGVNACIEGRCVEALGVGESCNDHDQCKDDYVCVEGACAQPRRAGDVCSTSDDCTFGLECDSDPNDGERTVCGIARVNTQPEIDDLPPPNSRIVIDGVVIDDEAQDGDTPIVNPDLPDTDENTAGDNRDDSGEQAALHLEGRGISDLVY